MRRSWAAVTVGALVLVVSAISYFLIRSTSERTAGNQGITVWALFKDASGLFEKSRVQTAGISIGQIDKRELDPDTRAGEDHHPHPAGHQALVERRGVEEVGVAARRVLPGDRSGHARHAR